MHKQPCCRDLPVARASEPKGARILLLAMPADADSPRMQVAQFPAAAANSLIEGYCDDFISLAVVLAQTLEQVSMRNIDISRSSEHLSRIESGMRGLSQAIQELLQRELPAPGKPAKPSPQTTEPPVQAKAAVQVQARVIAEAAPEPDDWAPALPMDDALPTNDALPRNNGAPQSQAKRDAQGDSRKPVQFPNKLPSRNLQNTNPPSKANQPTPPASAPKHQPPATLRPVASRPANPSRAATPAPRSAPTQASSARAQTAARA
jgi:hypothetical protein